MKMMIVSMLALLTGAASAMGEYRDPIPVGEAKSIELVKLPGRVVQGSRVLTTEGKSYFIYGTLQGIEGSQLTVEKALKNESRFLCGGRPRSCASLVS